MFSSDISARDTRQPFTVLLPDTAHTPIEIHDNETSLAMAVVDKSCVHLLDNTWNTAGVYILLSSVDDNGCYTAYVGKAPAGLRSRLLSHEKTKVWARALLITRVSFNGFSSAHAGWLEGDLYDLLAESGRTRVENVQVPGDKTVSRYDLRMLTSLRDPIVRVLRLLGYETALPPLLSPTPALAVVEPVELSAITAAMPVEPDAAAATRQRSQAQRRTFVGVTIADLIQADLIQAGEKLVAVRRGWSAEAEVVADGSIHYAGTRYRSLSGAAVAVRGDVTDGWSFWAVERDGRTVKLRDIRQRHLDARPSSKESSVARGPSARSTPGRKRPSRVASGRKQPEHDVTLADLMGAGLLQPGDTLVSQSRRWSAEAHVEADGLVRWDGKPYSSPSSAGGAVSGQFTNGWNFWALRRDGETTRLSALRDQYVKRRS